MLSKKQFKYRQTPYFVHGTIFVFFKFSLTLNAAPIFFNLWIPGIAIKVIFFLLCRQIILYYVESNFFTFLWKICMEISQGEIFNQKNKQSYQQINCLFYKLNRPIFDVDFEINFSSHLAHDLDFFDQNSLKKLNSFLNFLFKSNDFFCIFF